MKSATYAEDCKLLVLEALGSVDMLERLTSQFHIIKIPLLIYFAQRTGYGIGPGSFLLAF